MIHINKLLHPAAFVYKIIIVTSFPNRILLPLQQVPNKMPVADAVDQAFCMLDTDHEQPLQRWQLLCSDLADIEQAAIVFADNTLVKQIAD